MLRFYRFKSTIICNKMEFPDVNTKEGLQYLDTYFLSRSYISDYQPTQNDAVVFRALSKEPSEQFSNAQRWYRHIKNFGNARKDLPQATTSISVKQSVKTESQKDSQKEEVAAFVHTCYNFLNLFFLLLHPEFIIHECSILWRRDDTLD